MFPGWRTLWAELSRTLQVLPFLSFGLVAFLSRFAKFAPEGFRRYLQILSFAHPKGATSG